jgi:predicted RNA-binding protein Jag
VTDSQLVAVAAVREGDGRRAQAVETLERLLRAMEVPATIDAKDLPDGGISLAVHPQVELQGVTPGRRNPVGDALQYLLNKLVNRPGAERRWVSVGIGAHPEPRVPKAHRPALSPAVVNGANGPAPQPRPAAAKPAPSVPQVDERSLEVPEDPGFAAAARALALRSATTGRIYGIVTLSAEDRARLLRAIEAVSGVSARVEGEGRLRRVVLTPAQVVPMPRQRLPVDDVDGD